VQAEVLDLLRDLQRERHMAMLLVTHNFGVVADLCDRVTVMQQGLFVEQGPVRTILQHPERRSNAEVTVLNISSTCRESPF
jgi:ABC-type dipeptide/oligopeptide/nickel transport system ATPase component